MDQHYKKAKRTHPEMFSVASAKHSRLFGKHTAQKEQFADGTKHFSIVPKQAEPVIMTDNRMLD